MYGPFLHRYFNGQIILLYESLAVGEDRFVVGDFFDLPVQAFDGIHGADQGPDFRDT